MLWPSPSPKFGLSVALGVLLVSVGGPAGAAPAVLGAAAGESRFELIPASRSAALPPELRAAAEAPSIAESLGLSETSGSHRVQLRWVVREHGALSGYRVTLVAADGLPSHLAARWFVEPRAGVPMGDGLTAYATELLLALDEAAPIVAAVEAVDPAGNATLLAVRQSVVEANPAPGRVDSARTESLDGCPVALGASRLAPAVRVASAIPFFHLPLALRLPASLAANLPQQQDSSGAVSPRGPPAATVTT